MSHVLISETKMNSGRVPVEMSKGLKFVIRIRALENLSHLENGTFSTVKQQNQIPDKKSIPNHLDWTLCSRTNGKSSSKHFIQVRRIQD